MLLAGAVVLVVLAGRLLEDVLIVVGALLSLAAARRVFIVQATLPVVSPPKRPVLFYNPKSVSDFGLTLLEVRALDDRADPQARMQICPVVHSIDPR